MQCPIVISDGYELLLSCKIKNKQGVGGEEQVANRRLSQRLNRSGGLLCGVPKGPAGVAVTLASASDIS